MIDLIKGVEEKEGSLGVGRANKEEQRQESSSKEKSQGIILLTIYLEKETCNKDL